MKRDEAREKFPSLSNLDNNKDRSSRLNEKMSCAEKDLPVESSNEQIHILLRDFRPKKKIFTEASKIGLLAKSSVKYDNGGKFCNLSLTSQNLQVYFHFVEFISG